MELQIRTAAGPATVVEMSGELDRHEGLKEMRVALARIQPGAETRLVFHLGGVTYICSEAVGTLCSLSEEIKKRGGRVACCALQGLPKQVFDLLGVPKILSVHESEAQALGFVTSKPEARKTAGKKS